MRTATQSKARHLRQAVLAALAVLATVGRGSAAAEEGTAPPAAPPPPQIEPKAAAVLRAACDRLAAAQTMSFDVVNTYERAARNGQPLYYTVKNEVTLQRPDKLRVIKPGDGIPDEFYYDGSTMTAYVPSQNLVAVAGAPPTVDQMLDAAWDIGAIYFPFADVIVSHPCDVFKQNMGSAFYVGQSHVVGDTTTDIVAVAGDGVQAELWIGADDHLPRMVRVTYPNEPAHAHYQSDYSNWKLGAAVDPQAFSSTAAAAAQHIKFEAPAADIPQPKAGTPPPAQQPQ